MRKKDSHDKPQPQKGAANVTSGAGPSEPIPGWLATTTGWAWRLIVLGFAIFLVFLAIEKITLVFVAVFLALVLTAVLRPMVNLLDQLLPRALATILTLIIGLAFVGALFWYVVDSVAKQWDSLADTFGQGIDQIIEFLETGPLPVNISPTQVDDWITEGTQWLQSNAGDLAGTAVSQAGSVFRVGTALALAAFCLIFFLSRGGNMWVWFLNQLPISARSVWQKSGEVGWFTFSGYARGTVIITTINAILAGIFLTIVGVPLAAPLAVLIFIGGFIPLIGAPAAMFIAMIVALASHGIVMAGVVGLGIALLGQLEGNILQPLIMGKQVSLHPVIVALAVTTGTLVTGLLGAVVAVPLVAVFWAIYTTLRKVDPPTVVVKEVPSKKIFRNSHEIAEVPPAAAQAAFDEDGESEVKY